MANKFLDITGTTYLWGKIKDKFVQKEVGKGLSTNDFTTDEKNKLKGLNNYTLPTASTSVKGGVKVGAGLSVTEDGILSATGGGTADAVAWENVIGKPTKVSEFANDSGFQNATQVLSVTEDGILSATGGGTADAVAWENVIGKPTKVSEFANDSGFQNATQVNAIVDGKGFLKAVPTEYVTDTELNAKGFLTSVPSEYVTDSELTQKGYQTGAQVESAITGKGYQTSSQVQVNAKGFLTSVPSEYVTDSELTQKGYQTGAQVESAITGKGYQTSSQVQALINNAVSGITGIEFSVVSSLPSSGEKGVIYLVANGGKTKNIYDEYIWITDKFEKIGSTEIDLTPYMKKSSGEKGVIYLVANGGKTKNIYDEYIWITDKFEKIGSTEIDLTPYMKKTDMVEISNSEIDAICQ